MNSSIIGKIEKAHRYADEPDRAQIRTLSVQFRGEHDIYDVRLQDKHWSCTCHSYGTLGTCSHIMAMERLLGPMIPDDVPVSGQEVSTR